MKSLILVLLVGTVAVLCSKEGIHYSLSDAPQLFEKFIKDYKKVYKNEEDKQIHYEAFKKFLKKINQQNIDNPHATFGITEFADKIRAWKLMMKVSNRIQK